MLNKIQAKQEIREEMNRIKQKVDRAIERESMEKGLEEFYFRYSPDQQGMSPAELQKCLHEEWGMELTVDECSLLVAAEDED